MVIWTPDLFVFLSHMFQQLVLPSITLNASIAVFDWTLVTACFSMSCSDVAVEIMNFTKRFGVGAFSVDAHKRIDMNVEDMCPQLTKGLESSLRQAAWPGTHSCT